MSAYRHAVFACPPEGSELMALASRWLGRDPYSGELNDQPPLPGIAGLTAFPRRYGFHGTLVAPFRPTPGVATEAIDAALAAFCSERAPIDLPLRPARLGAFHALVPVVPSPALNAMAAEAVRRFHSFRAAPTPEETAKRRPERLTPRQRELLDAWHYPYVMDEFRFHMTLTGPVPEGERASVEEAIEAFFPADLLAGFRLDGLGRYVEPAPDSPFTVASRFALGEAG